MGLANSGRTRQAKVRDEHNTQKKKIFYKTNKKLKMLFSAAHNLPQFTKTIRTTQTNQTGTFQDPLLSSSPPISISTAPLNAAPYFSPRDEIMRGFEEDEISAGREKSGHVTSQKLNDNSSNNNNTKPSSVNITSNTSATNGATKPNKIGVGGGEKLQDGKYPQLEFARLSVTPRPQTQPPRAEDSVGDQSECDTKNPPASALSLHISSASPSSMGGAAEDSLSLIIYLPSTSPVDIQTSDTATVADVIQIVLQQTMDQGADCTIHNHAPQCYELRLHEGCGEPDEDFPALDRERQIKLFGEGGGGVDEYCLCQIMSVPVPEAPSITSGINSSSSQSQDRCRGLTSSGEVRVKINLPDGGHVVLSMPGDCVCKDLVKNIMTKHKIFPKKLKSSVLLEAQLLENYQFHVTEEDAKRLGHTIDTSVKMETSVKSLFVEELFFRPRHYEDDSLSKKVEPIKGNRADDVSKGPNLDDFMFDEITAGRYKEVSTPIIPKDYGIPWKQTTFFFFLSHTNSRSLANHKF